MKIIAVLPRQETGVSVHRITATTGGGTSTAELQTFVHLAAMIDQDNDGNVSVEEDNEWHRMIEDNTIWVGNIPYEMATDKHVRDVVSHRFGEVVACTVQCYNEKKEKHLNEHGADAGVPKRKASPSAIAVTTARPVKAAPDPIRL